MIVATTFAFLCLAPAQAKTLTWEEVLGYAHRDIRTLKGVYEEWSMKARSRDGEEKEATMRRWMDGKAFRQEIEADGTVQMAVCSDGTKMWTAVRPSGFFVWHDKPFDPLSEKWEGLDKPTGEESTMNIGMNNAYDLVVRLNPVPVVTKVEEVDGERRVHATVKMNDREMNLVLHFEKEKWLFKQVEGKATVGDSYLTFRRTKALRDQTFESNVFALDAKIVEGLQELTGEQRNEFLKAIGGGG